MQIFLPRPFSLAFVFLFKKKVLSTPENYIYVFSYYSIGVTLFDWSLAFEILSM
jgi:hypothetical protein